MSVNWIIAPLARRAPAPPSGKLAEAGAIISDHMDEILSLFKPGAKIAVVVRYPGHPERDLVMTNDLLGEIIGCLQRRMRSDAGV